MTGVQTCALPISYPELAEIEVIFAKRNGALYGSYNHGRKSIDVFVDNEIPLQALNHEIQHAIQFIEGFAEGGNAGTVRASLHEAIERSSGSAETARQSLKRRDAIVSDIYKLEAALKLFKNPRSILKMSEQFQLSGSADEKQLIAKGHPSVDNSLQALP